jgi:hypothetical protein
MCTTGAKPFAIHESRGVTSQFAMTRLMLGIAYAFVHRQWVPCHSEHYPILKGRSEREMMLATEELRQRYHNHSAAFDVTARQLAEFLQSVEAEESLLIQAWWQRKTVWSTRLKPGRPTP